MELESSPVLMIKNINGGHHLPQQQQHQHPMEPYVSNFSPKPLRFRPNVHRNHDRIISRGDDSEISIFDAQKYYFNAIDSKVIIGNNRVSPVNVNVLSNNYVVGRVSEQHRNSDVSSALPGRFSSSSSLDGYGGNYRARSFNATPTASSEASWNSQTGLLSNPPGAIAVSMKSHPDNQNQNKRGSSTTKWKLFGRKCPCSGKKSVQVEEEKVNKKQQRSPENEVPVYPSEEIISRARRISAESRFTGLGQRINIAPVRVPYITNDVATAAGFTFPVLNQTSSAKLTLNKAAIIRTTMEELPRESIEVFQPKRTAAGDDENKLLQVSRQSFTFPDSPPGRARIITEDDVASDASSDLFEIESFSTATTGTMYPTYGNYRRDSLDEAASFNVARRLAVVNCNNRMYGERRSLDEPATPSVAATECYEPSEASIDWSVTTAEGFDRGSVITNYSVAAPECNDVVPIRSHSLEKDGYGGRSKKKGNGGGVPLMSCRREKAVSVVGPSAVSKCVAGNGMRHVSGDGSSRTCNVSSYSAKPPVARSQSHAESLPFAT